jgi:hypothetical protein
MKEHRQTNPDLPSAIDEVGRLRDVRTFRAVPIYILPEVYLELRKRRDESGNSMNDIIADALLASDQLAIVTRQRLAEVIIVRRESRTSSAVS